MFFFKWYGDHRELHSFPARRSSDPALARGDCRLESEHSRLDARVETRLAAIIDALLGDEAGLGGDQA